jgi:alpha-tubulin suppressor-like RCC1 family protein
VADQAPPSLVAGLSDVTQIALGGGAGTRSNRHACARKSDGSAWCWGRGKHGVLGGGNATDTNTAAPVMIDADTALAGVTAVSAAQAHSCAIASDGVYCWGRNTEGELGSVAASTMFAMPTDPVIPNAVKIVSLMRTSCVVLASGGVWCWGDIYGPHPGPLSAFAP